MARHTRMLLSGAALFMLVSCADGQVPQGRNIQIPAPVKASDRTQGINEKPDSVMYLPLGRDVLIPEVQSTDELPDQEVGPLELRGETLGGALQLILADVDIPIAFETDLGLTRTVTVTNLKGKLSTVVDQVCSLANLYCSFEHGSLVIKDQQTFTVTIPPVGAVADRTVMMTSISDAIKAITGSTPVIDATSRTIIYQATNRTSKDVTRYLQRLRANTSLVVFETYVWEVSLNTNNAQGIQWNSLGEGSLGSGLLNYGIQTGGLLSETVTDGVAPITIGLPTKGDVDFTSGDVVQFMSSYGAVKTISQPQITVLSGSSATLRVADKENYVSEVTRTVSGDQTTTSAETDSVDSGFTLTIASGWDNSTVYGNIDITLEELRSIDNFDLGDSGNIQLPKTTERQVTTQVRIRPGDSMLIAGLVRENDVFDKSGLGVDKPIIPTSRQSQAGNVELVFLLKPRVIVFTDTADEYKRIPIKADVAQKPAELPRGAQQTLPPVADRPPNNAPVMVMGTDGIAKGDAVAAPIENDALSPVISRLFDDTTEPVTIVPPVERVEVKKLAPTPVAPAVKAPVAAPVVPMFTTPSTAKPVAKSAPVAAPSSSEKPIVTSPATAMPTPSKPVTSKSAGPVTSTSAARTMQAQTLPAAGSNAAATPDEPIPELLTDEEEDPVQNMLDFMDTTPDEPDAAPLPSTKGGQ